MTELDEIYADLGGIAEVAETLGVPYDRVKAWLARHEAIDCPRPVRSLRAGHIYSLSAWKGWFLLWKMTRGSETWNDGQGLRRNASGCDP